MQCYGSYVQQHTHTHTLCNHMEFSARAKENERELHKIKLNASAILYDCESECAVCGHGFHKSFRATTHCVSMERTTRAFNGYMPIGDIGFQFLKNICHLTVFALRLLMDFRNSFKHVGVCVCVCECVWKKKKVMRGSLNTTKAHRIQLTCVYVA